MKGKGWLCGGGGAGCVVVRVVVQKKIKVGKKTRVD